MSLSHTGRDWRAADAVKMWVGTEVARVNVRDDPAFFAVLRPCIYARKGGEGKGPGASHLAHAIYSSAARCHVSSPIGLNKFSVVPILFDGLQSHFLIYL